MKCLWSLMIYNEILEGKDTNIFDKVKMTLTRTIWDDHSFVERQTIWDDHSFVWMTSW